MKSQKSDTQSQPNQLRRKLFRGAPAGLGVLLAVQAKTALGAVQCASPSAILSGNQSPRPPSETTCSGGRSPGFWKVPQKFEAWGNPVYIPATFSVPVQTCASGIRGLKFSDIASHGTALNSIFNGSWIDGAKGQAGMWSALAFPNEGIFNGNGQLLRHLCAAVLNARYFQSAGQSYPLTLQQIKDMWDATSVSGGRYCPTSVTCSTGGWTKDDVIIYISGMYDDNAEVDLVVCDTN